MDGGIIYERQTKPDESERFEAVEHERRAISRMGRLHAVHWLIVLLSVVVTIGAWQYSKHQIALRTDARFNFAAQQVAELLEERLQKYELALWAGVAAVNTHRDDLNLAVWQTFANDLEIDHRYPGINGIGVIHQIEEDGLGQYLARNRQDRPDFRIHPPHDQNIYQPITFIEPVDINAAAVGLDMVHETNRHTSFNKARDTGLAQITGPIVLVQDAERTPGFLFFAPFYKDDEHATPQQRRANFVGAVYAPFVVNSLMDGVLDRNRRLTAIQITDAGQVIYDEIHVDDADYDDDTLAHKVFDLSLYGRIWTVDIRAGLDFRAENTGFESTAILVIGIVVDSALLGLFILLTRANRRGLRFADMATGALKAESQALKTANEKLDNARADAENLSQMKSTFLSTMSHEVRTPLTAISGMFELLERAGLPERQSKLVEAGQLAAERLMKLLTDVLDVSRLEANAVELWERNVELRPLVEEWALLATAIAGKSGKDLNIVTEVDSDVPQHLIIDDVRLSQIANNLIDNAVRFTEQGEVTVSLSEETHDADNGRLLVLKVADTGIGIAEEDLGDIFDRFRQTDDSITRETGGSGLGLAICHDLAKLMGGNISVASTLGIGSTFTVSIPIKIEPYLGE